LAALSDHDRRDAEHALRAEFAILVQKYVRRGIDIGKAYVKEELDAAAREGRSVDGTAIGRAAAARAQAHYFGLAAQDAQPAIEGSASHTDQPE
jgi:hypothetical protein